MRVLFVARADNPHTGRWISQLSGCGWDIHLFSLEEQPLHPALKGITAYQPWHTRYPIPEGSVVHYHWPFQRLKYRLKKAPHVAKLVVPPSGQRLAALIRKLQPDLIHALRMQNEAYVVREAQERLGGTLPAPWICSSWGSDIYLGRQLPDHRDRVIDVLQHCDYLICDCSRDVRLARELGYKNGVLGVFPTGGGFDVQTMQQFRAPGPVSARRIIAIKGYQHPTLGKALTALQAIRECADVLAGYRVVVHSAIGTYASRQLNEVRAFAASITEVTELHIEFMPFSPHEDMLKLFGRARVSIGISASDGTPNVMLESMIMGAFPIQSDTSAADEWLEQGVNGAIVPYDSPTKIAEAIRVAVRDDALVDYAAMVNLNIAMARLESGPMQARAIAAYARAVSRQ